jgi:hypothetical protein
MNPWSKLSACYAGFRAGMPRDVAQQIHKLL